MLVAGVDSSTQSTKVLLCRAEDGEVVGRRSAPHPPGAECDPAAWWAALQRAGAGLLERASAVAVAAQQHGMIALDSDGEVIRPALLWNDTRAATSASALIRERGGPMWWATQTGSVPNASFTVAKLRWLAEHEPGNADRASAVMLPHDWLTWRLLGARGEREAAAAGPGPGPRAGPERQTPPVTDRGDASGTGYYSPAAGRWLPGVAADAIGHPVMLPRIARPAEVVGETAWGAAVAAGTGDAMGAALGLSLAPGEVAVSIGTSGSAFAVTNVPAADSSGAVAGFADATGRYLPLVAVANAGLVLSAAASLLGTSLAGLSAAALSAAPGAGGLTLLPYLEGERTPNRPRAQGVLRGLTTGNATRENLARAAVEAVLASLADAADLLGGHGVQRTSVLLTGEASRPEAVQRIAPAVFGEPVAVPEPQEHAALGAARQAAWALAGTPEPPPWPRRQAALRTAPPAPQIRQRLGELRDATITWDEPPRRSLAAQA